MPKKTKVYGFTRPYESKIFAGFDLETEGLGGDLLMIQGRVFGDTRIFTGRDKIGEFLDFVGKYPSPVIWYAFNASYEWRYLLRPIIEKYEDVKIGMRTDSDFYEVSYKVSGKKIVMRDAAALFPMGTSLASFARVYCPDLPKLSIDIAHFDIDNPEHIDYAKRDVEILTMGLPKVESLLLENFNVGLGCTAAGTAMSAWEKSIEGEFHSCSIDNEFEAKIRDSYYGGLVFITDNKKIESNEIVARTYDINSSYPSVMLEYGVPSGKPFRSLEYGSGLCGIYHVRVRAPDGLRVPILPTRDHRGNMLWRGGDFDTRVTNRELIFALSHGYELLDMYEGYLFDSIVKPFDGIVSHCRDLRQKYKGTAIEHQAKLIQNSLYGKFATKRDRKQLIVNKSVDALSNDELIGSQLLDEELGLWLQSSHDSDLRCRPEWSVFITANARLKLLKAVYDVGVDSVLYGDTDSITVRADADTSGIDIGSAYGQFKLEKEWTTFRPIAPKIYAGILKNGEYAGAVKGLARRGLTQQTWVDLIETGRSYVECESLPSLRVGLDKGFGKAAIKGRVSGCIENSANYFTHDGKIRVKISA